MQTERNRPQPLIRPGELEEHYITEFQRRRLESKQALHAALGQFFLPGFLFFLVAGFHPPFAAFTLPIAVPLMIVGIYRAVSADMKLRRCPSCGEHQSGKKIFPYRTCIDCGVRLSRGFRDS
jgi:hypothetical protein